MPLKFFHVVDSNKGLVIYYQLVSHCMEAPLLASLTLGLFLVLEIVNRAAINVCVKVFI